MMIYAITNRLNGKRYIGMTTMTLARRWAGHKSASGRLARTAIANAFRRHGVENFSIEHVASVLPGLPRDELKALERVVIAQERTMCPRGYNMTAGGDGPTEMVSPKKGKPMSDEQRAKLRAAWARDPDRKVAHIKRFSDPTLTAAGRRAQAQPAARARQADMLRTRNAVMNQSDEHKAKLQAAWDRDPERRVRQAEIGRKSGATRQAPEWRAAHSERMHKWWAERRVVNGQ